ncbi:MAG TPA: hypothetical protein VMG82_26475 [Candidatus Sulfotelmatobacter sp.]|nr:hypothetical protein [Candidatus Sulfotelmatobacter sp.]
MSNYRRSLATLAVVMSSLILASAADHGKQVESAPIPMQILTARRVFIANGGGDDPGIAEQLFSGGPDRAYYQFYAAMKSAGHYELVGSPAEADLLFEIRFTVIPDKRPSGFWGAQGTSDANDAVFRLEIRDPKMNALLWAYNEHMEWAVLQSNRDKNFDQALTRLVADVAGLRARAAASATQVKP